MSFSEFVNQQFPSSNKETLGRKEKFSKYLSQILPTDLPSNYTFSKVLGDGSCFFHAILRYFGFLTWMDLPNKDTDDFNHDEELLYLITLSNLRQTATEYIRNFIGIEDFVLDPNVPEYQLICKYISDTFGLRIIILEFDPYKSDELNKVSHFIPESGNYYDTAILINLSHHFTLIFPTSTDAKYDTKSIRRLLGDELITKAFFNNKIL